MPNKKKQFLLYLLLATVGILLAQQIPYINYTTHNGLPQIQVQELYQDSRGYIWVGTKGGLAKFNGERFQHFLHNKYIYGIKETLGGEVYFITADSVYKQVRGNLKSIDCLPSGGRFRLVTGKERFWIFNLDEIRAYRQDTVYAVFKSNVDFSGSCIGLVYDKERDRGIFSTDAKKIYALKDKRIAKFFQSETALNVWCSDNGKVGYYIRNVKKDDTTIPGKGAHKVISIEKKETYFSYRIGEDYQIQDIYINQLPTKHVVLHNFTGKEIYVLDSVTHSANKIEMPFSEEMYRFIIDKDNNYWVGTDNGLYQLSNKVFRAFPRSYMNNCWTLIKGKDGYFYGGFFKRGLFRFNFEKGSKEEIRVKGIHTPAEIDFYYGASMDTQENLYFPTHNGLVKYDYHKPKVFDTGISLISKYDPYSKRVVFGQAYGIGFIAANEQIEIYTDSTKKLVFSHPAALEIGKDGIIWVGGKKGLVVFDQKEKKFKTLSNRYDVYPKDYVVSLTTDSKNNLWIGCMNGLWLYQTDKDAFVQVGKNIFNKQILSVFSPDSALLLVGTSHEVLAMRLEQFYRTGKIEYKMFNYRNGFFSQEVSQNSFCLYQDKVYIPSSTTTNVMNYKEISFQSEFFNVLVTSINRRNLSFSEQQQKSPFYVEKGVGRLNVEFETVGFGLPTYNRFKYKLEGVDDEWSEWTNQRNVYYSGLGSGKYVFRIMAKNGNYIEPYSMQEADVNIVIRLPFYKEPNFYRYAFYSFILLTFIVGLLIWKNYKDRIAVQNKEKKIKLLEVAALQAQISPHFIFNFLSSMQSLISRNMPEKTNEYLVKFSRLIRSYMESSIKSTKLLSGSTMENENTIKEEVDLLKTYVELESLKYPPGKINFEITIVNHDLVNKTIPPMMLQPFVENAIKHGILPKEGPGLVTIAFCEEGETLVCRITDDGIGRKQSAQNRKNSIPPNKSRGMQLIMNRVKMLNELDYNIQIELIDPPEGGTIVKITMQN